MICNYFLTESDILPALKAISNTIQGNLFPIMQGRIKGIHYDSTCYEVDAIVIRIRLTEQYTQARLTVSPGKEKNQANQCEVPE